MHDIFFVNPPIDTSTFEGMLARKGGILPPLGLLALAAYTRKENFRTSLLDAFALGLDFEDTVNKILESKIKNIGITAFTTTINDAAKLAKVVKEKNSEINILIGGSHISALPADTMERFPQFDTGIIGEGEITIKEILSGNTPYKDINGIIYRENGRAVFTKKRNRIENLDVLPFPAFDLLSDFPSRYSAVATNFKRLPTTSLVTTRGCPYQCTFCDRYVFENICRVHSASYIISLIKELKQRYGIRDISFYDDTFVVFKNRLNELCNKIINEQIDISWSCLARVDLINLELLKLMKDAGCWQISYGIESGNQKILDLYKKDITIARIKDAVKLSRKSGLSCRGFFMLGNPLETRDTIKDTKNIIKGFDDICITFFTPLPGAEIFKDMDKYGKGTSDWAKLDMFTPNFIPYGLNKKYLLSSYRKLQVCFYINPKIIFRYIMKIIRNREIKRVFIGLSAFLQLVLRKEKA